MFKIKIQSTLDFHIIHCYNPIRIWIWNITAEKRTASICWNQKERKSALKLLHMEVNVVSEQRGRGSCWRRGWGQKYNDNVNDYEWLRYSMLLEGYIVVSSILNFYFLTQKSTSLKDILIKQNEFFIIPLRALWYWFHFESTFFLGAFYRLFYVFRIYMVFKL